ncbi:TPA: hypothetical protein HA351_12860 [Methanosarcinaceae archaeon]|nr:hypothetical protein [Methanosarcinaceae archaeon]
MMLFTHKHASFVYQDFAFNLISKRKKRKEKKRKEKKRKEKKRKEKKRKEKKRKDIVE